MASATPAPTPEHLSRLIAQIYDAALDDRLWTPFLRSLAEVFDSTQAILLHADQCGKPTELIATVGLDLDVIGQWKECKEHVDLWLQHVFKIPEQRTYVSAELVPQADLHRAGFHADILRPLDIEHTLGGVPENSHLGRSFMGVYHSRRAGQFTPEQRHAYGLLLPHVLRAFVVKRRLAAAEEAAATAAQAVDRSPYAVVVLDRAARVVLSNAKAEALFRECDGITHRQSKLKLLDHSAQIRFAALVRDERWPDARGGHCAGGAMSICRPSGRRPYHLLVCPLNWESEESPLRVRGNFLVFIHDPTDPKTLPADLLHQIYGLTNAEARLCAALFETGSLDEAMSNLHITRNTAKAQLKQIFIKSGVTTQTQLLQHVALGLCRPALS